MAPVLWILAVLSTITVIHRIRFTYQMTKHLAPIRPAVAAPARTQQPSAAPTFTSSPNAPQA